MIWQRRREDDEPALESGAPGEPAAAAEELCRDPEPTPFNAHGDQPLGLSLEQVVPVSEREIFVRGWFWDAEEAATRLDLISPSGARQPILPLLARVRRPDVDEMFKARWGDRALAPHGFFALVEVSEPAPQHCGYRLRLSSSLQESIEVGSRRPTTDPFEGREVVLRCLADLPQTDVADVQEPLAVSLAGLQERCRATELDVVDVEFGNEYSSDQPAVTLVVPLRGELDLIEHQWLRWAEDPVSKRCEILYVLDSPEQSPACRELAFHLSSLYRVALRCLLLPRQVGYAEAVNRAAAKARGRYLTLVAPDVLPDESQWVEALVSRLESAPEIGLAAGKLLYEDRSLQHAGLDLSRHRRADGEWSIVSRYQGLPGEFPEAGEARQVTAVSGGCLMIERDFFEQLGGLRGTYTGELAEAVDLCLRCREAGSECWYEPAAQLYCLDTGPPADPRASAFDRALLSHHWDATLRETVE